MLDVFVNSDHNGEDFDDEITVNDPTITPEESFRRDLDADGDLDLIVVGTK